MMLLLLALFGCGAPAERCDVEAIVAQRAGVGAVDCGLASAGEDDAVHACLVTAFREGRPFKGLVEQSVEGGLLVRGWVGSGTAVELVVADFEACGEGGCEGSVQGIVCTGAAVEAVEGREQITCAFDGPPCGVKLCGADPGCD